MNHQAPGARTVHRGGFLRKERVAGERGIHIPRRSLVLLALAFAMAVAGTLPAGASAIPQPSTPNTPPNVPSNRATEYPQPEPVLHATFSDPDRGTGRVLFTIYDRRGRVIVRDAAGATVPSGADSRYTIPSGTLASLVLYSWTARAFDGSSYSAPTARPDFVATRTASKMTATRLDSPTTSTTTAASNPWGCYVQADYGHASRHYPKYILAEAHTHCAVPPSGVVIEHQQSLYRSSWSGWRFVGYNNSFCDSGAHSSGQPVPQCNRDFSTDRMRAWVWWNCVDAGFRDQLYHYRHVDPTYIHSGGTTYSAYGSSETGPWNQTGNVQCGKYIPVPLP